MYDNSMKKYFWSLFLIFLMTPSVTNAHEQVRESKKNSIDNYETITISQSGSLFYSVTNEIITSVNNVDANLSFIGRANIGMEKILDYSGNEKLTTKTDYLYSVSIKTVEKESELDKLEALFQAISQSIQWCNHANSPHLIHKQN